MMTKMEKAAQAVIHRHLEVKKGESVLILTNEPLVEIASILFQAAKRRTRGAYLLQLSNSDLSGPVADLMSRVNVVIAVTAPSISHTEARRRASHNGVRIASMPNITRATFSRLALTDLKKNARLSQKIRDILTIGRQARVSAPNGTDLLVPIQNRKGYADTGLLQVPGAFSNIPAGEACVAPEKGLTEGELIVDSGMGLDRRDIDGITLTIKNGRVSRIKGGRSAQRLRRNLARHGPASRVVAEFGIGTNANAVISGYSLEDEKVLGTIHIGVGNNISFGGDNDVAVHLDAVVFKASVEIDGRVILDRGRLVLE